MDKILIAIIAFVIIIGSICGVFYFLNENNAAEMIEYINTFAQDMPDVVRPYPQKDEYGNWYFTTDEDFKVLHLTDVHITGGVLNKEQDRKAINAVATMVLEENPDLVIVTGDIAFAIPSTGTINNRYAHEMFIELMEALGVYWTVTFGNHDNEPFNYLNRHSVAEMYADEDLNYCLFGHSAEGVSGEGNHVINIKNSAGEITQSLFMVDTHAYIHTDLIMGLIDTLSWNYDAIKQSQVDWYAEMIERYQPKSSLMFFHIPLEEVKDAYDESVMNGKKDTENTKWLGGDDGEIDEVVYASRLGDNMFDKVAELGNTKAMFFGHDHLNNFVLEYKGVIFSYGYSIDYSAYNGDLEHIGLQRGCTVLNISPDGEFGVEDIVHENYYQDKYSSLYEKEKVDMIPLYEK